MEFKKKLRPFGNSSGIIIDKVIRYSLGLKNNDDVWITIRKNKKKVI